MVTVVVFHSALGLRPAVDEFAQALRDDGHEVTTPDLYGGRTFETIEDGLAERDRIGFTTLLESSRASVRNLPTDLVYVGFSLGAVPAALVACERPGARGIVMVQAALTPADLGHPRWPDGLPVQVHQSPGDEYLTDDELDAVVASVPDDLLEVHRYPGTQHLFMDADLDVHDPDATAVFTRAVRAWLAAR